MRLAIGCAMTMAMVACASAVEPAATDAGRPLDSAVDVGPRAYAAEDFESLDYAFQGLPPVAGEFHLNRTCVVTAKGTFNFHYRAQHEGSGPVPAAQCTAFKAVAVSARAALAAKDAASCPDDYPNMVLTLRDGTVIRPDSNWCTSLEPYVTLLPQMQELTRYIPAPDAGDGG